MKKVFNETTGKYDVQFQGKLISVASDENVMENINGTQYRPCTIQFKDAKGADRTASGIIYEKNFEKGMSVGTTYLCTASEGDERGAIISVSHLTQSARVENEAFDFSAPKVVTKRPA
jgi:hypothetical protein